MFDKKFGFGLMRLPTLDDGNIDTKTLCSMVDKFIDNGFKYFDTAYFYMDSRSEGCFKKCVSERYPRDSYFVADKMPLWGVNEKDDLEKIFNNQLERTGAKYFDYYLLHSVNKDMYKKSKEFDAWNFLREKKKQGLIKHLGFSFHESAEFLEEVLSDFSNAEFVQLQLNYMDWHSESIQSEKCYKVVKNHGKKVLVMEPVKGGLLATLPDKAVEMLKEVEPTWTLPQWAMNFLISKDVDLILSGVSTAPQMEENIRIFNSSVKFEEKHVDALNKVVSYVLSIPTIACTNCRYCVDGCPQNIPIPDIIKVLNTQLTYNNFKSTKRSYWYAINGLGRDLGRAGSCIECGACERTCPQHLEIIKAMSQASEIFDN